MVPEGLTKRASSYGPAETAERFIAAVTARGAMVLARIDHAAAAAKVQLDLRPTEVILFGNPRAGTPLMKIAQTAGIDLPLKALVWEDETGQTWLGYNEPDWVAARHGLGEAAIPVLGAMAEMLEEASSGSTQPPAAQ